MTIQFAPIWDDAALAFSAIRANATDSASANTSTLLELSVNGNPRFVVDKFGELIITPTARTSGSDSLLSLIAPADTTRAAGTEATDINFNLARTVQFAAGNITNQRAIRIQAPTYSFASASTITNASTLSVSGAPVAGTNATLTNRWALSIENNGMKLAFPSTSTSSLGLSRPSSNQWMYLVNTTNTSNRPIGIVFGGYDGYFHMALQSVMTSGGGNTYGKLSFVQQGGSEWLKIATSLTAEQNGVSIAESLNFGVLASDISPDTSLVREAAGVLAFRRSTTSHIARLYNTFTDDSNYERLALQFGTFSSVRHAQIVAESAGTGTANMNLVLTPRGNGAFIVGPPPDGTGVGGNARGSRAVDLQRSRASVDQVASGSESFIGSGSRNTASGLRATVVNGNTNAVSNEGSIIGCGQYNSITSFYCGILGGSGNTVSAQFGHIGCGLSALSNRYAMRAFAAGQFATGGDCQGAEMILRGITTTNVAVRLRPDGSSQRLTIASGQVCQYLLIITGVSDGGADVASYMRQVTIKNIGGATSLVGTVNTIGVDNAAGTSLSVTADDTNDDLAVEPTGVSGQTWRWECLVYGGEIRHG